MWFPILSALWQSKGARKPAPRKPTSTQLTIEALEGRCVPAFLAPVTTPAQVSGVRLAVGDFNHDGRDDVAIVGGTVLSSYTPYPAYPNLSIETVAITGKVTVRQSNGDGTFQPPLTLSGASGYYLTSFYLRDMNSDGKLDVVVTSTAKTPDARPPHTYSQSIKFTAYENVWFGKGDGTFGTVNVTSNTVSQTTYAPWPPIMYNSHTSLADFNRDGVDDSASFSASTPFVSVALGKRNETYQPATTYAAGPSPGLLAAGDFNGDGRIDLIAMGSPSSANATFSILLNDGIWPK